jgi:hypothetical protein
MVEQPKRWAMDWVSRFFTAGRQGKLPSLARSRDLSRQRPGVKALAR